MKHKLKIEALSVETFAAAEAPVQGQGTVRGFAGTNKPGCAQTVIGYTCPQDCYPSFEFSCGYPDTTCPMA